MFSFKSDQVIAITGGTGSFGRKITEAFLKTEIGQIRIISRDEKKQEEVRNEFNDDRLKFFICDVRDFDSVFNSLRGVDFVFHAAALKQVPSCEFFPLEAVKTNVIGAENVIRSAIMNNIKKMVMLSTDKAVYPINAMGQSKALMEKVLIASGRNLTKKSDTSLALTRYGNVMASRGSIIPLVINQIKTGLDITITDPSMTRFLMSLDDSVDLVMYAFENSEQGDLFIQKSPASTIGDLVAALLKIFDAKNEIKIIGTRHGEKLYESLVSREEMIKSEDLGNYFRIPADYRGLNYSNYFTEGNKDISNIDDYNSHNTIRLGIKETIEILLKLDYVQEQLK
tara:strand:+ start:2742 stop:3761 length:1020 start_codon:yes stop_codon:yes gene_type:complete